jgi:plasmid stabilization system protein ParE
MECVFTEQARRDLQDIGDYIAQGNPQCPGTASGAPQDAVVILHIRHGARSEPDFSL